MVLQASSSSTCTATWTLTTAVPTQNAPAITYPIPSLPSPHGFEQTGVRQSYPKSAVVTLRLASNMSALLLLPSTKTAMYILDTRVGLLALSTLLTYFL